MGVITLPWSMEQDRENQIKANSVHVDDNFNTLLNATNGKLEADGSITPTADLPMGSHKITGLATPTLNGDAATKGYVDSRDSTLDATYVKLTGAQTVAGVKTFSSSPVVPTPTTNMQASTKKYVDDNITTLSNACVKLSGNQTIAGTKTFSSKITGSISGNCDGNAGTVTNGVYTTGNQTIGGTKTFSASPLVPTVGTLTDNSTKAASTKFVLDILKAIYPVGSLYIAKTSVDTCPLSTLGVGTWTLRSESTLVSSVNTTAPVNITGTGTRMYAHTTSGGNANTNLHFVFNNNEVLTLRKEDGTLGDQYNTNDLFFGKTDNSDVGLTGTANITRETISVRIWERTA